MTPEQIERNRRKRFVRRCYKKSPLWVISLVRERYPDYDNSMLEGDLRLKYKRKRKPEKIKNRPNDFRSSQIRKYVELMNSSDIDSRDYHKACIMISRLTEAHIKHKDIFLSIRIGNQTIRYGFHWKSTEEFIKTVASLPQECSNFEQFEEKKDALYKKMNQV